MTPCFFLFGASSHPYIPFHFEEMILPLVIIAGIQIRKLEYYIDKILRRNFHGFLVPQCSQQNFVERTFRGRLINCKIHNFSPLNLYCVVHSLYPVHAHVLTRIGDSQLLLVAVKESKHLLDDLLRYTVLPQTVSPSCALRQPLSSSLVRFSLPQFSFLL